MRIRGTSLAVALSSLAIAALLLSSAGTVLWHHHDDLTGRVCQVCHVGYMPVLHTSAGAPTAPPVLVAWHVPAEDFHPGLDPLLGAGPSRAPPA